MKVNALHLYKSPIEEVSFLQSVCNLKDPDAHRKEQSSWAIKSLLVKAFKLL